MHPRLSSSRILAVGAATLLAASAACGGEGGTNPPPEPVVASVEKQPSTDNQTVTVATPVPVAPAVVVRDADGEPIEGVIVLFTVVAGGGQVDGAAVETDANGIATVDAWILGTVAGANSLRATAGTKSTTFTATSTPGEPSQVLQVPGTEVQTTTAGSAVPIPPGIRVTDAHDNAIADVAVTFQVVAGGGAVSGATQSTNASGVATVGSWTVGPAAGHNELTATAEGFDPLTFTATGTAGAAANVEKVAATDAQSAAAGSVLGSPPSVKVTDAHGNAVVGVTVTFDVASGGGSITGRTPVTDATGVATVGSWTLGSELGPNSLTATVEGFPPVTFTATGTAGAAANVTKVAPTDGQSATAGSAVPNPPAVTVTDANGHPVPDVIVRFALASGGGTITDAAPITDEHGRAAVGSWTLGVVAGENALTAAADGLPAVTFTATGTVGAPAWMDRIPETDGHHATVGTAVPVPPAAIVTDFNGNPVAGVAVTFVVASGGGSVTGGTTTTNAQGIATVGSWTLGTTEGENTLTASASGLPSVTFTATAVP